MAYKKISPDVAKRLSVDEVISKATGETYIVPAHVKIALINDDCIHAMKLLPRDSVHAIISDPPYELGFMGKHWDKFGISYNVDTWKAAYRVLKPGGYMLIMGGTRTFHRVAVAIEDAGFEIKDCLMWLYGQGFPKGLNISKAIDKHLGKFDEREITGKKQGRRSNNGEGRYNWNKGTQYGIGEINETKAATPEAQQWEGWNTTLKPAYEPIILAQKPISEKTIAQNVLVHETGGMNIDATRIATDEVIPINKLESWSGFGQHVRPDYEPTENTKGRWPANVILFEDVTEQLDEHTDTLNGASRFFYVAKVRKKERNEGLSYNNRHLTVKPIDLMSYLVKLITPPNGIVLDPFCGSGSTGIACALENKHFIGIDEDAESITIARDRIDYWKDFENE